MVGEKSAQVIQFLFSGRVTGIKNKRIITPQNIIFAGGKISE